MNKKIICLILLLILCVGFLVRYQNFRIWPREGATFDEFAWTFLGLSILNTGTPTSWSPHSAYKEKVHYVNPQGASFFLVTPYLEHPPLFGIVAGAFAKSIGIQSFDDVKAEKIRPLALALGIFSVAMVFLLTSSVYGNGIGLIASGIYALVPTVAVGSRLVQNENFFIPFFLLILYLTHRYLQVPRKGTLGAVGVLSMLLPLAKIPWIAAPIAVAGVFIYHRKWKETAWVSAATLLGIAGFFAWGYYWDKEVFLALWKLQLARYDMSYASFFTMFLDPLVTDRRFIDGWIYIGWTAMILLVTKPLKKQAVIVFGFLAYFAIYIFGIPSEPGHGWYRYPFYPFLVIALGVAVKEYFNKNRILTFLFLLVGGLSMLSQTFLPLFGFSYPIYRSYIVLCGLGALPQVLEGKRIERAATVLNYMLLFVVVGLSIWASCLYNEQ